MNDIATSQTLLRVADLPQRKPHTFALSPDAQTCTKIADRLDLTGLRKLSFTGTLRAEGKRNWRLDGKLGATVVQPCVVTLAPVTSRIDQPVSRRFLHDWQSPIESDEVEMPEDDSTEPLSPEIDLIEVLTEALTLALPDYPRAPEATLEQSSFAEDGVTPMSDDETKPFAGLAALKDKLEKPDE